MKERRTGSVGGQARQPRFLWRGLLIVVAVAVLAAFGMLSLRQDQRLVEGEVRERARQFADDAVERCWKRLASLDSVDTSPAPDAALQSFASVFHVSAQGELILPLPYSAVPVPNPLDAARLSPEQAALWQRLGALGSTDLSPTDSTQTVQAFLSTKPPAEFAALAHFRLAARLRLVDEQQAAEQYRAVVSHFPDSVGETGLPLAPLATLQLTEMSLISSASKPLELRSTLNQFASNAVSRPTVLTSMMLSRAADWEQHYLNGTNLTLHWRTLWNREVWNLNEPQRRVFRSAVQALDGASPAGASAVPSPAPGAATNPRPASSWPDLFWFHHSDPLSSARKPNLAGDREANWLAMKDQHSPDGSIRFVCRQDGQVRRIVEKVAQAELSLPEYLAVEYQIAGRTFNGTNWSRFLARQKVQPGAAVAAAKALPRGTLALATHTAGDGKPLLAVAISLLDPSALYHRQRQRLFWFGTLLGVSALLALIGLCSAWSAFRQQQRLYQMQSNFVSSVTHELRAPIGALRLMAETFQRGQVREPAEQNLFFDYIVQECCRLSSMVENILNLARIEQGRKEYEFEPTDVVLLVEDTLRLMQPNAAESKVALELQFDRHPFSILPAEAILDGRAIQQALINLIDNAIKHSPPNSVVTLGMALVNTGGVPFPAEGLLLSPARAIWLSLWVADQGSGIPPEEHRKIFERFYRRESELRRETPGIGIGLSIVKHIIEAHSGRVRVESEVGKGSRFILELPLAGAGNPRPYG
ncbi:MAG: ATP-binding protein [Limisphaerales bacterium]